MHKAAAVLIALLIPAHLATIHGIQRRILQEPVELAERLASRVADRISGLTESLFTPYKTSYMSEPEDLLSSTRAMPASALTAGQAERIPFVLIHGAIQGGWVWEYPMTNASTGVKGLLEAAGHRVYNPTLPHHDRGTWTTTADMTSSAFDYVDAITDVILSNNLTNVVLVAHSLSGVWTQLAAQQVRDRLSSVVFANAVVLVTGESFFTNRVAGLAGFPLHSLFTAVFGAPVWPYGSNTPLGLIEKDAWQTIFMNTRQNDRALIEDTYERLMPEPRTPEMQNLDFNSFYLEALRKYYVYFDQDLTM
eukprot:jgi/Botrbrau1/9902/Bobra.0012s0005.1